MSTQPNEPVTHCTAKEPVPVYNLGERLLNKGIYINATLFPNPPVDKADFEAANDKLGVLIAGAKGDSESTKLRDEQCFIVYGYVSQNLLYVKLTAKGDAAIIIASGFDLNDQPVKTVPPEMPVIKKVSEGKIAGTYKVLLTRKQAKLLLAKKANKGNKGNRYTVQVSLTPLTESSWVSVLDGAASTKLLITGLAPQVKAYIRVFATNSAGKSPVSAPFPFTPQ
jgi:hypothetical protein